jgi:hypothetical protein
MSTEVQLWMSFGDDTLRALSIPVKNCQCFSRRPLAWLRYLGYCIYGKEGHISTVVGGPEVNYNQDTIQGDYYYVSQSESYSTIPGPVIQMFAFNARSPFA